MNEIKFLFIGGLHRSGTTIANSLLGTDSRFSVFKDTGVTEDEGQYLQSVLPLERDFGAVGEFALHPEAHLTEDSIFNSRENSEQIFMEWAQYWDISKEVLVEKTPINLIRTRLLRSMFPRSFFLIITRHPVATSLAATKWKNLDIEIMLKNWIKAHKILLDDLDKLNNRDCAIIKYEDFIADPTIIGSKIEQFTGFSPELDYSPIKRGINDSYFRKWKDGNYHLWANDNKIKRLIKSRVFRYKFKLIEKLYERNINRFGYSFNDIYN